MQALGSLHSQACKYWNVNGTCSLCFDCMLQHLTYQHLERASVSDSVTISVMQQASNTCKCSYLNILQASLHPCLHDKAKHALMKLQACSLYIHFTTLKGHHLASIQPNDLDWANHIYQCFMVADININESQSNMLYLYQRSHMGTSASCQGSKAADMGETCSCKQTSGLTLYRLLWPGRSSHGRCGSFRRSTHLQRKWTMLLYPRYINDHASI